jgi:response regulator RpfG family c-di-GMP phosphodiesterase
VQARTAALQAALEQLRAFDALASDRVYRAAHPLDRAAEMMRSERGGHFDPHLLDLFLDATEDVREIRRSRPPPVPEPALRGGDRPG